MFAVTLQELATWAAIVVPIVGAIIGAHVRTVTKVESVSIGFDALRAAVTGIAQDYKELSERVRKIEVDVKEAISNSTLIADILGRLSNLEKKH